MTVSRRTVFFFILSVVCLLMIPPTPSEFRVLNVAMAGLAFFWTIMLAAEDAALSRERRRRNRRE
jgi:hypothetical protein